MLKRGIGGHVDWIIAMGLFLVFITSLFVFFKPGITPLYQPEILLNIVEKNFINETELRITKIPIFVQSISYTEINPGGPATQRLTGDENINLKGILKLRDDNYYVDNTIPEFYNFLNGYSAFNIEIFFNNIEEESGNPRNRASDERDSFECSDVGNERRCDSSEEADVLCADVTCEENTECFSGVCIPEGAMDRINRNRQSRDDAAEIQRNVQTQNPDFRLEENQDRENSVKFDFSENNLIMPVLFPDDAGKKSKYLIIASSEPLNLYPQSLNAEEPKTGCIVSATLDYESSKNIDQCHAKYDFGGIEEIKGFSLANGIDLNQALDECEEVYECTKERWGYPTNKEFRIRVLKEGVVIYNFPEGGAIAPLSENIFVREFKTTMINDDGITTPITININVW